MTRRESLIRKRLGDSISVHDIDDGDVSILCPSSASRQLWTYLNGRRISATQPKTAVFARDSEDEIVASAPLDRVQQEVAAFVASVPLPT
jgi:hypothetical protein